MTEPWWAKNARPGPATPDRMPAPLHIPGFMAVTKHYGPSPMAMILLPLVSAIVMNILNAVVIQIIVPDHRDYVRL